MPRVALLHPIIPYKNKLLRADVFLLFREDLRRSAARAIRKVRERRARGGVTQHLPLVTLICWIVIFTRSGAPAALLNHLPPLPEPVRFSR